jgi:hypothetical protein
MYRGAYSVLDRQLKDIDNLCIKLCTENPVVKQTEEADRGSTNRFWWQIESAFFFKARLRQLGKIKRNYALIITNNLFHVTDWTS